jgi:polyhydroxybutyrate depolymerase
MIFNWDVSLSPLNKKDFCMRLNTTAILSFLSVISTAFAINLAPPLASPANAEGKLRELIKERMNQRKEKSDASNEATTSQDSKIAIDVGGHKREFLLHLPKGSNGRSPLPLVVAFHGGGGDMEFMADDKKYGLISKSDEAGFIVAFPNGVGALGGNKLATWNAGKCCGKARDESSDDVAFVRKMIEEIKLRVRVDTRHVYATGMSNGGMMSHRLACEMSDTFAAIAAVAGTDNTVSCNPSRKISILHIHALNDDHVLFNGGAGPGAFRDESKVNDFTSVPATIAAWSTRNTCKAPVVREEIGSSGAYCEVHAGCAGDGEVKLCVTPDGGHSWPGGGKTRIGKVHPSEALSANDLIWDFFLKHGQN